MLAIKEGDIYNKYDGHFIFAEVNGDIFKHTGTIDKDNYRLAKVDEEGKPVLKEDGTPVYEEDEYGQPLFDERSLAMAAYYDDFKVTDIDHHG